MSGRENANDKLMRLIRDIEATLENIKSYKEAHKNACRLLEKQGYLSDITTLQNLYLKNLVIYYFSLLEYIASSLFLIFLEDIRNNIASSSSEKSIMITIMLNTAGIAKDESGTFTKFRLNIKKILDCFKSYKEDNYPNSLEEFKNMRNKIHENWITAQITYQSEKEIEKSFQEATKYICQIFENVLCVELWSKLNISYMD